MARGYVYEIRSDLNDCPVGQLEEGDLYENAGHAFDYILELNEEYQESHRDHIIATLKKAGCKTGTDTDDNVSYIIVTESAKKNYFQDKFKKLQEYVKNLTLGEFSSGDGGAVYNIGHLVDDIYGDAVYLDGSYYDSFDYFIRNAEPGEKYYFGNVLQIH